MRNNTLLLLLFISLTFAGTYTVSSENIANNRFYALTDLLEQVPVLQTHIFDVADMSLSTAGYNSLHDRSVLFCVDGLPLQHFYDGKQLLSLFHIQNYDIDSIVVFTGTDVYRYNANVSAVINLITKRQEKYNKKFFAKPYVGSEIGDPTLLKKILPADSIPPNKDQYIAGEASGALLKEKFLLKGGITIELMDPYTSFGEGERSLVYDEQNAHQSLTEIKEGITRFGFTRGSLRSITTISGGDYRLFRYNHFNNRYYYYEGINGSILSTNRITLDKLSIEAKLFGHYDQGDLFVTVDESQKQKKYSGAGEFSGHFTLAEDRALTGHIALSGDKVSGKPQEYLPHIIETTPSITAHVGLTLKKSAIRFFYPPGTQVSMKFTKNLSASASLVLPEESSAPVYKSDMTWKKVSPSNTLEIQGNLTVTPTYQYKQSGIAYSRDYHSNNYRFIPQLSVENRHFIFGRAYGAISNYGGTWGISRDIPLKDLYIRGQLDYTLPTYWNNLKPLSYGDRNSVGAQKLDAFLKGNLSLIYKLRNDKVRLCAAVRNIGKKHTELPIGSLVGPVFVTNFELNF